MKRGIPPAVARRILRAMAARRLLSYKAVAQREGVTVVALKRFLVKHRRVRVVGRCKGSPPC